MHHVQGGSGEWKMRSTSVSVVKNPSSEDVSRAWAYAADSSGDMPPPQAADQDIFPRLPYKRNCFIQSSSDTGHSFKIACLLTVVKPGPASGTVKKPLAPCSKA